MNYELHSFTNTKQLELALATKWIQLISGLAPNPRFLAISGGRGAELLFNGLVNAAKNIILDLSNVHFFWVDDRCVLPNAEESNYALAQKLFLRPMEISNPCIHRILTEIPPVQAVELIENEVDQLVPKNSQDLPMFDLVVLGMGEDGHIASLTADPEIEYLGSRGYYAVVNTPKPPPKRITLTMPVLAAARHAWVIIAGPGKSNALANSIKRNGTTALAQLIRLRQKTILFSEQQNLEIVKESENDQY
jgi:6-phosphogluconolactonase